MGHHRSDTQLSQALAAIDSGDVDTLAELLRTGPELATVRDDDGATLLIRLIDWPGQRPNAAAIARLLLDAGSDVDARRADDQGTSLSGVVCTKEADIAEVLLAHGADPHAPCGFQPGTVLDLVCQLAEDMRYTHELRPMVELFRAETGAEIPARPQLGRSAPVLFVRDIDRALVFYRQTLGFRLSFSHKNEERICYAIVARGGSEIHLAHAPESSCVGRQRIHILCDPAAELCAEYERAGVELIQPLTLQSWGLEDFVIADPEGNQLEIRLPDRGDLIPAPGAHLARAQPDRRSVRCEAMRCDVRGSVGDSRAEAGRYQYRFRLGTRPILATPTRPRGDSARAGSYRVFMVIRVNSSRKLNAYPRWNHCHFVATTMPDYRKIAALATNCCDDGKIGHQGGHPRRTSGPLPSKSGLEVVPKSGNLADF